MLTSTTGSLLLSSQPGSTLERELTLDGHRVNRLDTDQHSGPPADLLILAEPAEASLALLREVRADLRPSLDSTIAVLYVADTDDADAVIRAFDAGADDVLRFPCGYPELLARIRALLRRHARNSRLLVFAALRIDTDSRSASYASRELRLTRLEFDLLAHLAREPHRVHSPTQLLADVWGYRDSGKTRTVDSHISRLRKALRGAGCEELLTNVRGVGYRLATHPARADGATR